MRQKFKQGDTIEALKKAFEEAATPIVKTCIGILIKIKNGETIGSSGTEDVSGYKVFTRYQKFGLDGIKDLPVTWIPLDQRFDPKHTVSFFLNLEQKEKDLFKKLKIRALRMVRQGASWEEINDTINGAFSARYVYDRYMASGLDAVLNPVRKKVTRNKLSDQQEKSLADKFGKQTQRASIVRDYIMSEYKIQYSDTGVRALMRRLKIQF